MCRHGTSCLRRLVLAVALAGAGCVLAGEQVLVEMGSPTKLLANASDPGFDPPMDWAREDFDPDLDSRTWSDGAYGVGYDKQDQPNAWGLISTPVASGVLSVYTRAQFVIDDPASVENVYLGADFDDGYAAWINGAPVWRDNIDKDATLTWDTTTPNHESSNGAEPNYEPLHNITLLALPELHPGINVLAVALWNVSNTSTDFVIVPRLSINRETGGGTEVSGTLTQDTVWTLADSPYTVVGDVTVPKGVTLTIEPGVVVGVRSGLGILIQGNLQAVGTPEQRIQIDRDGSSGEWDGLRIDFDGEADVRSVMMQYVDVAHAHVCFDVEGTGLSPVWIQDCRIDSWGFLAVEWDEDGGVGCNNLVFRRCEFAMHSPGAIRAEAIHAFSSAALVERCTFGPLAGYNDTMDIANSHWGEGNVPTVRYNVIYGGDDDGIDFDNSDGIIEGNIVMNRVPPGYDPPHVPASYPPPGNGANGGGITGNEGSSPLIINNIIYHCYHGIGYKNGARPTLISNTVVNCTWGIMLFYARDIGEPAPAHGILRNNLIWNCGQPIRLKWYDDDPDDSTADVQYCALEGGWEGAGNVVLTEAPIVVDPDNLDFAPLAGRPPVIDAGTAGLVPYEGGDAPVPPADRWGTPRIDDPPTLNTGAGWPPFVDMGAVEFIPLRPTDINGDGCVNVSDLVVVRTSLGATGSGIDPPTCDVNWDGVVNVSDFVAVRIDLGVGCP